MSRNWHHFSAKEHADFLVEHGFHYLYTKGSHDFYVKKESVSQHLVQVIGGKERQRQSRKTMEMSIRHSGILKQEYTQWINR